MDFGAKILRILRRNPNSFDRARLPPPPCSWGELPMTRQFLTASNKMVEGTQDALPCTQLSYDNATASWA